MHHVTRRLSRAAGMLAAAAMLWLAIAMPAFAANNIGLPTIPFTVKNNTGSSQNLFIYVAGNVPSQGNASYYMSTKDGDVRPTTSGVQAPSLDLGPGNTVSLRLPQLGSMRIYFVAGKPLQGGIDPRSDTLFDFAEFNRWDMGSGRSGFGGNLTQVDMFTLAMFVEVKGVGGDFATPVVSRSGFADPKARPKIFAAMAKAGPPWSKLVIKDKSGAPVRVMGPPQGIDLGLFPKNYLKSYVNEVFQRYEKQPLVAHVSGLTFKGLAVGNKLVFNQADGSASFTFDRPDTRSLYAATNAANPQPTDPAVRGYAGAVAGMLHVGFMRSTMLQTNVLDACRKKQFYRQEPVNEYAAVIHEVAYKHLAYAYSSDDICGQSSYIQVYNPTQLTITLQPL